MDEKYFDEPEVAEKAKAEWDRDASLREEFEGDYEAYLAGEIASAKGLGKILRSGGYNRYTG